MEAWLQKAIHFIEEGEGARTLRLMLAAVIFVGIAMFYDIVAFKNFNTEEAMDLSQLARNISRGEGYTTKYIRPFSLSLIQSESNRKMEKIQRRLEVKSLPERERKKLENDWTQFKNLNSLKIAHPDISNAPLYPTLLAGFLKLAPIDYKIPVQIFQIYAPELWIAAFNQFLFFLAILLLFKIARDLFGPSIAWISTILFTGSNAFWRFSISGLPTMLAILILLGLTWVILRFEKTTRESVATNHTVLFLSALSGLFVGLGCLTVYSLGWLIGPVLIFLLIFSAKNRFWNGLASLMAFAIVVSPWIVRNYSISGSPFGTAGYAICQSTPSFPEDQLDRSLQATPVFSKVSIADYARKLFVNGREIVESEIPKLGGSWLVMFFFAGLLMPLNGAGSSRLRYFVIFSLILMVLVQAFGKTHLTMDSAQWNSENLLIVVAPLVIVLGTAFYFDLIERIAFRALILKYTINFVFCVIISLPLILNLLPPKVSPVAYPPYFPPTLQETGGWMRSDELIMCDVPWAMSWYADRQCILLSRIYPDEFFVINDDIKTVQALHLTPKTIDRRFLSQMINENKGWGRFVLQSLSKGEVPDGFPLKKSPQRFLPDQFFVTDWERWRISPK